MIIGCLTDRVGRARIEDGVKGFERMLWVETFTEVLAYACDHPTETTGAVVGWIDARDVPPAHLIRELRRIAPWLPILGYCKSSAGHLGDLRRMAVAGVHELILDVTADSRTVVRLALEATRRQCAGAQVFAQIQGLIPEKLHAFVQVALDNPARATTVRAVARELGVDRKTLLNWCAAESFLPPRDLLRWSRLLLAAALLNWSGRSIKSVALELEYPTDNSLRTAIRRQFKIQPSAMKRGGVDRAVNAFRAHIAQRNQPGRRAAVA